MIRKADRLFAVKMRASRDGRHVSGAERIVPAARVSQTFSALAERALRHSKGAPDFVNLKAEAVGDLLRIPALPVTTFEAATVAEGWAKAVEILRAAGVVRAGEICGRFRETSALRG